MPPIKTTHMFASELLTLPDVPLLLLREDGTGTAPTVMFDDGVSAGGAVVWIVDAVDLQTPAAAFPDFLRMIDTRMRRWVEWMETDPRIRPPHGPRFAEEDASCQP